MRRSAWLCAEPHGLRLQEHITNTQTCGKLKTENSCSLRRLNEETPHPSCHTRTKTAQMSVTTKTDTHLHTHKLVVTYFYHPVTHVKLMLLFSDIKYPMKVQLKAECNSMPHFTSGSSDHEEVD